VTEWIFVELGGSSSQSTMERNGEFQFFPGVVSIPDARYALAVPGVIRFPEVLFATNLGWPEVAKPSDELSLPNLELIENDVVAAGLGEAVLRSSDGERPARDLLYLSLGTGIGSCLVVRGRAWDADIGHTPIGGENYCTGCRSYGCLNSEIEARRLSTPLSSRDIDKIVSTLVTGLDNLADPPTVPDLVVLGGGIVRTSPIIADRLGKTLSQRIETSMAPPGAKSAAFLGLRWLAYEHHNASRKK
jgi:predicted NBD/HSP70 family sugar kinase